MFFLTAQCNSNYIIGFYGAFFVENRISICTEYMDGELKSLFSSKLLCVCVCVGGSLENYGAIPEELLGRIIVSVR